MFCSGTRALFGLLLSFCLTADLRGGSSLLLCRLLNNFLQHLSRGSSFCGAVRCPNCRCVLREDVVEVAAALHAERCELRDVDGSRPVVAMLDEQPASPFAVRRSVRADE